MSSTNLYSPRKVAILLLIVFIILCTLYLLMRGIRSGGDTPRYTEGAQRLIQGLPLVGKQRAYPGYIALVALAQLTPFGLQSLIAMQILVAALAALSLYRIGSSLGSPYSGLLGAALFLFNPEIIRWHTYVLTDSLYISAVVLATHAIFRARCSSLARVVLAYALIALCISLRPNGWLLVPVAIFFWLFSAPAPTTALNKIFVLVLPLLFALFLPGLGQSVSIEGRAAMPAQGIVIWGYDDARLPMPPDHTSWSNDPLLHLLQYILFHPFPFLRLAAYRVATELLHVRPYYSPFRNLFLLVYLIPTYVLATIAFIKNRRHAGVQLIAMVIAAHFFIVALTFADWDGRFLLYSLPRYPAPCRIIAHEVSTLPRETVSQECCHTIAQRDRLFWPFSSNHIGRHNDLLRCLKPSSSQCRKYELGIPHMTPLQKGRFTTEFAE